MSEESREFLDRLLPGFVLACFLGGVVLTFLAWRQPIGICI